MLVARRFTLNPVLVIISLVFWFWMWGIPGVILSMPMLAITRSFATVFSRWLHLATSLRAEYGPCPLWVISGHSVRLADVGFTPNSGH